MSQASDPERLFFLDRQTLTLTRFDAPGHILDLGGGGEGIIGQLQGAQVVAIDPRRDELAEAAPGPLKLVMDARELQFLDESFGTVTAFFTLLYIKDADWPRVFAEAFRVLVPGGWFRIWDALLPPRPAGRQDLIAAIPLTIHLPQTTVETGYGAPWPAAGRDLDAYLRPAIEAGFIVTEQQVDGMLCRLELRKPPLVAEPASLTAVAIRWIEELWQRRNLDALPTLHAPDFQDRSPAGRGSDLAAYRQGLVELFTAFPDFYTVLDDLVVDESAGKVALRWTATATHAGPCLGCPPTGRTITCRGIELLRIVDGLIVERWGEWDGLDLLAQLQAAGRPA